jgi:sugar phosphate isomerase/epimerase
MNRRDFTKSSAMAALSAAFLPNFERLSFLAPDNRHIGVQLWSVKEEMEEDASKTIIDISKMGYSEIETFFTPGGDKGKIFGMNAKEFKTLLKNLEMKSPSGHYPLPFKNQSDKDPINDEAKRLIDFAQLLGQKFVILPYVMPNDRTPENYAKGNHAQQSI